MTLNSIGYHQPTFILITRNPYTHTMKSFSLVISIILFLHLPTILAVTGYLETCYDCFIKANTNNILTCWCADLLGGVRQPELDLNQCVENDNGLMKPMPGGNFGDTCKLNDFYSLCWTCTDNNGGQWSQCPGWFGTFSLFPFPLRAKPGWFYAN
jgi:hypothetical protein